MPVTHKLQYLPGWHGPRGFGNGSCEEGRREEDNEAAHISVK